MSSSCWNWCPGQFWATRTSPSASQSADTIKIKDDGDGLFVSIRKDRDGKEPGINAADEGQFIVELTDALGNPAILPVGSTAGNQG